VNDSVVSKHHAVIEIGTDGRASISDLGSRNGTFLNGKKISGRTLVGPGDRVMFGWTGPLFEVRAIGDRAMPEGEGAEYRPGRQPPKSFGGMVISAGEATTRARRALSPLVFTRTMVRQMLKESSALFRAAVLVLLVGLIGAVGFAWRSLTQQAEAAQSRLAITEEALAAQRREADSARVRSAGEIAGLRAELADARRNAISRAVVDSLEGRLRDAERRAALSAGGGPAAPDFARVARENQHAVGLVIVRYPDGDSVMGSGFAVTASGYFVTNRHVVRDEGRGDPRAVEVIMADRNVAQRAEVVSVSTERDQDIAVLLIRNFQGEPVQTVDWYGRGAQQGAPAAMLGFPGGAQLALDANRYVRTTMFDGIISQTGPNWLRFGGTTFSGASGSPIFNAAGEVIAVHFGVLRDGPGLGFSVPMTRVRRWLPSAARRELNL